MHSVVKAAHRTFDVEKLRHEQCVYCGMQYLYPMRRRATGVGFSVMPIFGRAVAQERADQDAYDKLARLHATSSDPVRCPSCHGYQPNAIKRLRWQRTGVTLLIGAVAALVAFMVTLSVSAEHAPSALGAVFLSAALLAPGWWFLFDPNNGKFYLYGISSKLSDEVISLEAHLLMVEARQQERLQAEAAGVERRQETEAARADIEAKAAAKKAAQMREMAERAKRDIGRARQ